MFINIDFETRSAADLIAVGAYKYAQHPTTEVLCIAYAMDDGEVKLWTRHAACPPDLWDAALRPSAKFRAFNVGFERRIWDSCLQQRLGWPPVPLERWYDTQADALTVGYPADLKRCANAMNVAFKKDAAGTRLINLLSKPIKGTDKFREWAEHRELFEELYEYCKQDVRAERAVFQRLKEWNCLTTASGREREAWLLTERMNDRGVPIDVELATVLRDGVDFYLRDYAQEELTRLTNGEVRSGTEVAKMNKSLDQPLSDFRADTLKEAQMDIFRSDRDQKIIELRQAFGNTSVAKYAKMLEMVNEDGYVRDLYQYHAAATGRLGGRGIQPQNFPRDTPENADQMARRIVEIGPNWSLIEKEFGPIQEVAKSLLRATISAPHGEVFVCRDYSAIEARATAWTVLDMDQIRAFERGEDVYIVTASTMYGMAYNLITKQSKERQAGKIAVLACGYQGGIGALQKFALGYGISWTPAESNEIVKRFRYSRASLVSAWYSFERAAKDAIKNPGEKVQVDGTRPCVFQFKYGHLSMKLPNGKLLWFPDAEIEPWETTFRIYDEYLEEMRKKTVEKNAIVHSWVSPSNVWMRRAIHGGSLFQSYVQAICREIMFEAMLRLEKAGWRLNLSVHDELAALEKQARLDKRPEKIEQFEELMTIVPEWATGFPIGAAGWEGKRYRK